MKTTDVVNLTDLQKKYEELGAEIKALEQNVIHEWPQEDGKYWFVNASGIISESYWENDNADLARKASHNIFRTKEEAQAKADWRQMTDDLWAYAKGVNGGWEADWSGNHMEKWLIKYHRNKIIPELWYLCNYGVPAFKSEALAQQAINHFGDRLNILRDYRG